MYPLYFSPILKTIIWGGADICPFKSITPAETGIGESWEISQVKGSVSTVANGPLAGKSLTELIESYGTELLGSTVMERFGAKFPLLIKFIDAQDDLSIQVHPDDTLGMARHNSFGKTEMWYVVKAADGAKLYSGLKDELTPESYVERVADNTITDALAQFDVEPGDSFFLPAGRIHAIGAGCFIAEIQQNSDITYRIYDYDRRDANGNGRELHTELAKDAIDYQIYDNYKQTYDDTPNQANELASCQYFTTNLLRLDQPIERQYDAGKSFVIYMGLEGTAEIKLGDTTEQLVQGRTILVPAAIADHAVITPANGCKLLECYIK